jgi:outer membrane protein OmpA-like peptidoglycan-associated protein
MRRLPLLCLAVAGSLFAARASAADCDASASTCIDSEALWPTAGPSTFFAVPGGRTTPVGRFGFGLSTSIQRDPIVLRTSDASPAGSVDVPAIGTQVTTSFLFSYGVTDRLEASVVAPISFYQNGTGVSRITGPSNEVSSTAIRDMRVGFGYALLPLPRIARAQGVGVVASFDLSIPSGDHDDFGGDRSFVGVPRFALEDRLGRWIFGGSIGARIRSKTTLVGANVGSQLVFAAGIARAFDRDERYVATMEVFGLPSLVADGNSPWQWLLGFKWSPLWAGDFAMHAGGGGKMRPIGHSPIDESIWRFVFDIRYAPLGNDTDHDGVLDRDDKCQNDPEDRDGFHDDDGCPDPDNDGDGVLDAVDACKDVVGPASNNGCPIEDKDKDGVADKDDRCVDQPGPASNGGCPESPKPVETCADGSKSLPGEACDVDHDGVPDVKDKCPTSAEDMDGIVDEDGCPEKDADEDGVGDQADKCPLDAETIDGVDDFDGCPEEGAHSLVTFAHGAIELEKVTRFAAGSAKTTKAMDAQIPLVAQRLQGLVDRGVEKIVVESWGDAAGDTKPNQELAQKRAEAIRAALIAAGIPEAIVFAKPGDLEDPPKKGESNWIVTVRTKRKEPLSVLPPKAPPP